MAFSEQKIDSILCLKVKKLYSAQLKDKPLHNCKQANASFHKAFEQYLEREIMLWVTMKLSFQRFSVESLLARQ